MTAHDRCDACGAQAYVSVSMISGELLFCGHHYEKHKVALEKVVISVIDERKLLVGT